MKLPGCRPVSRERKLQIELREGDLKISGSSGGGQTGNVKRVENQEDGPKRRMVKVRLICRQI